MEDMCLFLLYLLLGMNDWILHAFNSMYVNVDVIITINMVAANLYVNH